MSRSILNQLIDKYERSKQKNKIHISIRLTKQILPEYFDLNSDKYLEINKELQNFEELGYILLDWKDNRIGHIIERVRLIPENVDELYSYLNRIPQSFKIQEIITQLEEELNKYSNLKITSKFLTYILRSIRNNRSVSEYFDFSNINSFKRFLSVLSKIENNVNLLYLREFSGKASGDTKYVEQNLNKFINVLFKFSDQFESKDTELILNYFNIYRNPIFVYLKGNLKIKLNSQKLDLSKLSNGLALSSQDLKNIEIRSIKSVITIENLTTYNRFVNLKDTLILYSRGFANSELIKLLKRINKFNKHCNFYHFGDIDIGGFQILMDLINKTRLEILPIFMDKSILNLYQEFAKTLTINDKKRLENTLNTLKNSDIEKNIKNKIEETLKVMKAKGIKLEQEVIDINEIKL